MRRSIAAWAVFVSLLSAIMVYGVVAGHGARNPPRQDPDSEAPLNPALYDADAPGSDSGTTVRREAVLMGSHFVFIVEADKAQALAAIEAAAGAIRALEAHLTSWRPGSDISRINDQAGRMPVRVAPETIALLKLAKEVARRTHGAFDVTVGAVWDLWPFRDRDAAIPSQRQITEQLALVGAEAIRIDERQATVYLPKQGMKVNLGAIGKGYAAELAIETMRRRGIRRAAVSAGGDLLLLGRKGSGPWRVEVEHPRWPGRTIERFAAGDVAVATSSDSRQYRLVAGRRYGHIIDPRTGWPAEGCQSVTIMTGSAALADAYATAVFVMGPKTGMAWVEAQAGVEALIVDRQGRVRRSSGWRKEAEDA